MAAVVGVSKIPVMVKIRLGWDAKSIVALDFAQAAESIGIAAVTVHARTKAQGFSGQADWSMIKLVKDSVTIPVIGNGDVRTAGDVKSMIDETGCDGVMIGRAIQGYPWIFREARQYLETGVPVPPPSLEERQMVMLSGISETLLNFGENIGIREMRKHLCWYTKGLQGGAEFRRGVNHLDNSADVKKEIGLSASVSRSAMVSQ
jgi:tRNA-dihydrouridine synthase B